MYYSTLSFFFVSFFINCFTNGFTALRISGVVAATDAIRAVETTILEVGMYWSMNGTFS